MTTITQYLAQVREEWRLKRADLDSRFGYIPEKESADFWEAKIRERESALRLALEEQVGSPRSHSPDCRLSCFCRASTYNMLRLDFLSRIARIFDAKEIKP